MSSCLSVLSKMKGVKKGRFLIQSTLYQELGDFTRLKSISGSRRERSAACQRSTTEEGGGGEAVSGLMGGWKAES